MIHVKVYIKLERWHVERALSSSTLDRAMAEDSLANEIAKELTGCLGKLGTFPMISTRKVKITATLEDDDSS